MPRQRVSGKSAKSATVEEQKVPVEKSEQDSRQAVDECRACAGRGWKLRTARLGLLVRTANIGEMGPAEVECWRCSGSGVSWAA
jgi:hypothetical protein